MPDIVPAGLPVPLVAAGGGWSTLGAAIIEVKAALDGAVSEAKGTWTGEAADAFTEWWETRSAPLLELGAACEAVAAALGVAVGETTAANATWVAAAASAAGLAPAIPTAGVVVWEGGLPAILALISASVAPLLADPFTAAEGAAIEAACTTAATVVFTTVNQSIGTTAAAVGVVGALATATVGAMVIGVDSDVPGSGSDMALGVAMPMAMGAAGGAWEAAAGFKAIKGADTASKVTGTPPLPFKGRGQQLDNSVRGGSKARQAVDAGDTASHLGDSGTVSRKASRASDAGHTRSVIDDASTPSKRVRWADEAKDSRSRLDEARSPSDKARHADDAGDRRSQLDEAQTAAHRARDAADAKDRAPGLAEGALAAGAGVAGAAVLGKKAARSRLTGVGLGGRAGQNFIGKDTSILGRTGLRGLLGKVKKLDVAQSASSATIRKNEAFLGGEQLKVISELSGSKAGQSALHRRGFWTDAEVKAFADKPDWSRWEKLTPQQRLQLATLAAHNRNPTGTPAELMALSIRAKTDPAARAEIYKLDAQQWAAAMDLPAEHTVQDAARANTLKRIFGVLQSGELKQGDAAAGFTRWQDDVPVAAALSHGGRVEIRIPAVAKGEDPDAFFKHIFGPDNGKTAGLFWRPAGTHYVEVGSNKPGAGLGAFKEKLGTGAAIQAAADPNWKHYGLDLPVGGIGNADAAGGRIAADGRHGHFYVGYKPPSEGRDGVLLIGAETERPNRTNALGNVHDWRAKSADMGPATTHKSDRIGANDNGRIVDLNELKNRDSRWMDRLTEQAVSLRPDELAGPPRRRDV